MTTVVRDSSPADLLTGFRGEVFSSRPGYPEVLLLKVRDGNSREWWFSTFHAEFSPSDPGLFLGKTIVTADLRRGAELIIGFSDGSHLKVSPIPLESGDPGDDLETWSLITPDGVALDCGPDDRWAVGKASDPV